MVTRAPLITCSDGSITTPLASPKIGDHPRVDAANVKTRIEAYHVALVLLMSSPLSVSPRTGSLTRAVKCSKPLVRLLGMTSKSKGSDVRLQAAIFWRVSQRYR